MTIENGESGASVRAKLNAVRDADQIRFLTFNVDQAFDASDVTRYCVWRTGANWTGERNITFNGVPPSLGRIIISNNSGHHVNLLNGTSSPLDVPLMPFRVPRHEYVELAVFPGTRKLIKIARGAEVSSSTIVPDGGLEYNALCKFSDDDFHFGWRRVLAPARSWLTNISGALDTAIHSGRGLVTSGNITVPTDAGFRCVLKAGGAHTVTFNEMTSPAMSIGDVMRIEVQSATVINAELVSAASLVVFA